jgi:hypothetical protein
MEFGTFFSILFLSSFLTLLSIPCLSLAEDKVTTSEAVNPITEAVRQRIEKAKQLQPEANMSLKDGAEPPSPLAPQVFDGFQGQTQIPFTPDDREKVKMAQENQKQRLRYEMEMEKKRKNEESVARAQAAESGKSSQSPAMNLSDNKLKKPGVKSASSAKGSKKTLLSSTKLPNKKTKAAQTSKANPRKPSSKKK